MKKKIFTVCVDNYLPELCLLTIPTIQAYADRIGASFELITERKFPDYPPTYEKMQVWERGRASDYNILIDADMLISRGLEDVTSFVPPNQVGIYMTYDASMLFEADQYFARDGRKIGLASNFIVTPNLCHDIWEPLPGDSELWLKKTKRQFIIDEYCLSRNLAKYGLGVNGVIKDESQIYHLNVTTDNMKDYLEKAKEWLEKDRNA